MSKAFQIYDNNHDILEDYANDWNVSHYFEKLKAAREANNERAMVKAANEMWFGLPDRPAIRTHAFFKLCDIAEMMNE